MSSANRCQCTDTILSNFWVICRRISGSSDMLRVRLTLIASSFLVLASVLALLGMTWLIAGPDIDNRLQLLAGRDLNTLRNAETSRGRLEDVVKSEYRVEEWKSYHFDEVYLTVIDCLALDRTGRKITLSWEVGHNYSPRPDVERRKNSVYALTREAALLAPDLMPPGVTLESYPETWARIYHSSALAPIPRPRASQPAPGGDPDRLRR